jgi:hypothetical protein
MAKDAQSNRHKALNNGHAGNGKAVLPSHFGSKLISAIPRSRKGKHNLIVSMILDDLYTLELERAVLVPLESLEGEKMGECPLRPEPGHQTEKNVRCYGNRR